MSELHLVRLATAMIYHLGFREEENRYEEDGEVHQPSLQLVAVWDDGEVFQALIYIDAGHTQGFVGYGSYEPDARAVETDVEALMAQLMHSYWIMGDGLVEKVKQVPPGEINWRNPEVEYPVAPKNLDEVCSLAKEIPMWINPDFQNVKPRVL